MKHRHKELLGFSILLFALTLGSCSPGEREAEAAVDRNSETPSAAVAGEGAALKTATLNVEGMTCAGCVLGVRTALQRLDGVEKAEVSNEEERAVVSYDPARVTFEDMARAIEKVGFLAVLMDGE